MSLPLKLIGAAMHSRADFDLVAASGEGEHFPDGIKPLWEALAEYYGKDQTATEAATEAAITIVGEYAGKGIPSPKARKVLVETLQKAVEAPSSEANVRAYLVSIARQRAAEALSFALAARKPEDEVAALIQKYTDLQPATAPEELGWEGILARRMDEDKRLKTGLRALDEVLDGGPLPGHNITLFARPEVGKTALALTLACGWAKRGHKVLYVGNEDPAQDLMVRAIQILTGSPRSRLIGEPSNVEAEAFKRGIGNLVVRELSPGTVPELERLVRQEKPEVLVVDQLRNLRVAKMENMTQRLDMAAQAVRALGKRYGMVTVSVTQAGDSARNKPTLDDGDIDSSNTGIPGAADVLIGMGKDQTLDNAGMRRLSLCKNKVSGRHDVIDVVLDPLSGKIKSR